MSLFALFSAADVSSQPNPLPPLLLLRKDASICILSGTASCISLLLYYTVNNILNWNVFIQRVKILTVCDQGNNRSVQFSHLLKYWNHDVIPIGIATTSEETLLMLFDWADVIILTDSEQKIPQEYQDKVKLFDVGEDNYPRPFNPELYKKAKELLEKNKSWLKK